MAKNHHESKVQQAAVRWFSYQYPELTLYAIPNGGKRNPVEAAIMKLEGVKRGIPDLFLAHAKGPYHGLYIEMKYGDKGKLSPEQIVMIDKLKQENYAVEVARDVMQFIDVVNAYLKL